MLVDPDASPTPQKLPRVLVLDDSAAHRKMLVMMLRRWGYDPTACGDAEAALELAQDPEIGLIVSDWVMPGMTGPEFCRRLKAMGHDAYRYVILLTAKSDTSDLSKGLEAGADDFLTKPVSPPELKARLNAGARIVATQAELIEKTNSLAEALSEIQHLYDAIETDLDEARRVQASFHNDTYREFACANVHLWLKASGHVGGDMVGSFEVSPHVFGFYSMDVSGHGVAAGMMVARVAGMLNDNAPDQNIGLSSYGGGLFASVPPNLVAAQLNAQVLGEVKGERYLTLCLGYLDQRNGLVRMVQAGHPRPVLMRASGQIELLGAGGMPLGLIEDAVYHEFRFRLEAGDRLMLYSDGLTECPLTNGEFLEEEGLVALCRKYALMDGNEVIPRLASELEDLAGGVDFPDDISALLIDFTGS